MSGTQGTHMSGVEETAKQFWSHRPRRPVRGRKIAGVAAGIGNHYRIDPVIVRVALVVTTLFGGAGLVLYLLGWLFLPQEQDEVSAFESMIGRGRSSTSTGFTILLCLALFPASSWFFGGSWFFGSGFSGVLGVALLVGGLYLLQKNRGGEMARSSAPASGAATTPTKPLTGDVADMAMEGAGEERTTPPAWDPLGAAPFAWDLPEPSPAPASAPPPAPRKRRSKITLVNLGTALVTVGICVAVAPLTNGWMTPAHVIGAVVAVLGLGMVGGSFSRSGRGLIAPALVLATIGVIMTSAGPNWHHFRGGLGDQSYTPASLGAVHPSYHSTAGDIHLDLRSLPKSGNVHTSVDTTFGNATVEVPDNADVTVNCTSAAGNVDCLGRHQDGLNAKIHSLNADVGPDGPGGLKIQLDVRTTAGNVEVSRG
ncbi:MAG: PspC domain-containing protein [Sciscionella sp.]